MSEHDVNSELFLLHSWSYGQPRSILQLVSFQPRLFGGVLFAITIYAFLIIIKKDWDWEYVKFGYLVLYSLLVSTIIMEGSVTALLFPTLSAAAIGMHAFDLIIMPVLLILGIYSYSKQRV